MKARVVGFALLALVGPLSAAEPASEMTFTWVEDSTVEVSTFKPSALRMVDILGGNLVAETQRLISTVGIASAAEELHLQNLNLPRATPGRPRMTAFKFTSDRIRNPRNSPDPAELAALDHFRSLIARGSNESSQPLVQKVERPGAPTEWRLYRPLATMPICLYCHGPVDSLQPAVRAVLHRRFPEDEAVDYGSYAWRGIIRVSYELPAAGEAAPSATK